MIESNATKLYAQPDTSPHRIGTEITNDELSSLVSLGKNFGSVSNLFSCISFKLEAVDEKAYDNVMHPF